MSSKGLEPLLILKPFEAQPLASDTCSANSSSFVTLIPSSIRRNFQSYAKTETCQACGWKQKTVASLIILMHCQDYTGEQGTNYPYRIIMVERKKREKLTNDWRQTAKKSTEVDKRIVLQVAVVCGQPCIPRKDRPLLWRNRPLFLNLCFLLLLFFTGRGKLK